MGRLFFLGSLTSVAIMSLSRPWIGVVAAYVFAVLTPQAVWYWNFDGIRPVLMIFLPTMVGFIIAAMRNQLNFEILKNRRMLFLAILWLAYTSSYYFGPFVDAGGPYRFTDPDWAMSTLHKVFVLFFIACVCIDSQKKANIFAGVLVVSAIYLTYWANSRYLSGTVFGRLAGPVDVTGTSIYSDENNFAMLFVVSTPFLWYLGFYFRNRILRWGLWLVIPLAWHAVFLTASRGGLVGLAVTTAVIAWRSKNKAFGFLLIPAFVVVYLWQAGDLMRGRAETIEDFRVETSASTRLEAWETATLMVKDNLVTGVGLSSFGPAFPSYSEYRPREAHNTFLQISAESGIVAGLMYLLIVLSTLKSLWRNGMRLRNVEPDARLPIEYFVNEATLVSFFGLVVCSLFLSLQMFEIFFYLCVLANSILYLTEKDRSVAETKNSHRRSAVAMPGRLSAGEYNQQSG